MWLISLIKFASSLQNETFWSGYTSHESVPRWRDVHLHTFKTEFVGLLCARPATVLYDEPRVSQKRLLAAGSGCIYRKFVSLSVMKKTVVTTTLSSLCWNGIALALIIATWWMKWIRCYSRYLNQVSRSEWLTNKPLLMCLVCPLEDSMDTLKQAAAKSGAQRHSWPGTRPLYLIATAV